MSLMKQITQMSKGVRIALLLGVLSFAFQPAAFAASQPVFTSTPITHAAVGLLYVYQAGATDNSGQALTYSLVTGPAGMTMSADNGIIRWTPSESQGGHGYAVQVRAYNSQSQFSDQRFTITVAGATSTTASTHTSESTDQNTYGAGYYGIFGGSKTLAITNVVVTSGPKNVNQTVSGVNCSAVVSWETTIPTGGQVVFGTVSQPDAANFSYPYAATEGVSLSTIHQVALPVCLEQTTYYFRLIVFTKAERLVSDEKTILPIPIESAAVSGAPMGATGEAGASILGTIGKFLVNPFVLVVIIAIVIFYAVRKFRGRSAEEPAVSNVPEPVLDIPHR